MVGNFSWQMTSAKGLRSKTTRGDCGKVIAIHTTLRLEFGRITPIVYHQICEMPSQVKSTHEQFPAFLTTHVSPPATSHPADSPAQAQRGESVRPLSQIGTDRQALQFARVHCNSIPCGGQSRASGHPTYHRRRAVLSIRPLIVGILSTSLAATTRSELADSGQSWPHAPHTP